MKADEYVVKMYDIIHDGGDENEAIAYLVLSLMKEIADLIESRNASRRQSVVSIYNEVSKKYEAVKKRDPFYWGGKDDPFMKAKLIDLILVADQTRGEALVRLGIIPTNPTEGE